ncbi:MAG: ISAzo13-like element transposase-related protein [Solirubrobacteraceae bacterium]
MLLDPDRRGDPCSPLRWSSKSLGKRAGAAVDGGHQISGWSVGTLLRGLGFRLHANAKTKEANDHPDRDAQFRHINETARAALAAGEPTISIDTSCRRRHEVSDADLAVMPTLVGICAGLL